VGSLWPLGLSSVVTSSVIRDDRILWKEAGVDVGAVGTRVIQQVMRHLHLGAMLWRQSSSLASGISPPMAARRGVFND